MVPLGIFVLGFIIVAIVVLQNKFQGGGGYVCAYVQSLYVCISCMYCVYCLSVVCGCWSPINWRGTDPGAAGPGWRGAH